MRQLEKRRRITPFRCLNALSATAILLSLTGSALAYTGQKLACEAKVSIDKAHAVALKAHLGTITDEELEREGGGSGCATCSI